MKRNKKTNNMKNYYLFSYDTYHAHGGFRDFVGRFDSLENLKEFLKEVHSKKNKSKSDLYRNLLYEEVQLVEITDSDVKILIAGICAKKLLNALKKNKPIEPKNFRMSKEERTTFIDYFENKLECLKKIDNV